MVNGWVVVSSSKNGMNKKEEDVGKVDGGWMAGALGAPRRS